MKNVVLILLLAMGGVFVFSLQSCCWNCPEPECPPAEKKGLNVIPYFLENNAKEMNKIQKRRMLQFDSLSINERIITAQILSFETPFRENYTKIKNEFVELTLYGKGIKPRPIPLPLPSPICHCYPIRSYKEIDVPNDGSIWKFEIYNGTNVIATSQMGEVNDVGNLVLKINSVNSKFEGTGNMKLTKINGKIERSYVAPIQIMQQ